MNINSKFAGIIFALLAALFNGMVGVLSVNIFNSGLTSEAVAFFKCLIALFIVGIILLISKQGKNLIIYLSTKWKSIAICSFFGFFVLYHFETAAYKSINVAVVVFCLFGASTITTFLVEAIMNKRFFNIKELLSITFAIIGLYFIFADGSTSLDNNKGLLFSILAGIGYGLFIVLSKKLDIGAGLIPVFSLLLFGVIYLLFPFMFFGFSLPSIDNITYLIYLAILPTIGGFWCTTKALTILKSQSVQLIELTEPIFAIIFAIVFLGQVTTFFQLIGGLLIICSIIVYEFLPIKLQKERK